MIEIKNIKVPIESDISHLEKKIKKMLKVDKLPEYRIVRRSIDARNKPEIFYVYTIGVFLDGEYRIVKRLNNNNVMLTTPKKYTFKEPGNEQMKNSPLIIGSGPAGLFCAYLLALSGYRPMIIERGSCVEERTKTVEEFFKTGKLNTACNIQFGEGGAGTFSDGKLNTMVKDKYGRIAYVLDTFINHGANPEIAYDSKPHIGTDILSKVIINMRKTIEEKGGVFCYNTKAVDFLLKDNEICGVYVEKDGDTCLIESDVVILAIGHSARDTFKVLRDKNIPMEKKPFAMGVRVEHKARDIQKAMYGRDTIDDTYKAASYKLTYHTDDGRSVYSFCMCPGGYVVNASSEEGRVCVNGMSYSQRDGINSNSAIVVNVTPDDFGGDDVLSGVEFQRRLEENIYNAGGGKVLVSTLSDFENGTSGKVSSYEPQIKGGYTYGNLAACLPDFMSRSICSAMKHFGKIIEGFDNPDTIMSGVESRTSSPVKILRDESFSSSVKGLYPCGEGAGYAGGIVSAAVDGIKVAEAIIERYSNERE